MFGREWDVRPVIAEAVQTDILDGTDDCTEKYFIIEDLYSAEEFAGASCYFLNVKEDNMGFPYVNIMIIGDFNMGRFVHFPDAVFDWQELQLSDCTGFQKAYRAWESKECVAKIKSL